MARALHLYRGMNAHTTTNRMEKFYRIQPAGKGIDHTSETSSGESDWLHVFSSAWQVWNTDGNIEDYGDEVVEIEAPRFRDNGDVEGCEVNPVESTLTRRWSLREFAQLFGVDDDVDFDEIVDVVEDIDAIDEIE